MQMQKFNLPIIKIFIATAVCIFLFLPKGYTAEEKGYVPGEIIVKFKVEAADSLEREILQKEKPADSIRLNSSLDRLNKKYGVKEFKQIFRNFKENREKLENLRLKNEVKIKYSLNQILFTEKERHLLKRLKRAPKDAKIPDLDRIYKLELEEGRSVEEAVAEYSKDPNIEYAQPNYIYKLYATPLPPEPYIPNDYYIEDGQNPGYWRQGSWGQDYPDLWGHQKIQAIEAWNLFDTNHNGVIEGDERLPGEGVIVAVIDTGVDYNHEDLHANIWRNEDEIPNNGVDDDINGYIDDVRGYDISDGDNDPIDYHGHGTHCSGTIAAMGDNTVGIAGVAYGAKIMPVKVFPRSTTENCAKGIRYAAANGADVLSNSWGPNPAYGPRPSEPTLEAAIDDAYAEGCVVVFAAGNSNDDVANWSPANYSKTIAVAATDYQDSRAEFSCFGNLIDVAAPGVDVLSLRANGTDMYGDGAHIVDDYYYRSSGTSMACPHVAGLAALLLSYEIPLGADEIRQIVRDSADDLGPVGFDIYYGSGRINAYRALLELASPIGRIVLDKNVYSASSEAVITVLDTDLNANSEIRDTVTVELRSSTETTAESVILTEVEADKGIFRGSILIEAGASPLAGDGKLTVRHNDIITATYLEGDPPGAREATASVDLLPPIIDSVERVSEITLSGEPIATITWHTDERSNSVVFYGTTPSLGSHIATPAYITDHVVNVNGLEPNTLYYFAVESGDIAGNVAIDDNGGALYQFTIIPPMIEVMPSSLLFEALEGATTPLTQTFTISNIREPESVDLLFEIHEPLSRWLLVSPVEGRITNASSSLDIQVTVDPTRLKAGTYTEGITINHNIPLVEPMAIPVEVTVLPTPVVHYKRYRIIDDWSGRSFMVNGDGRFNPGERVELQIELENWGSLPAQDVIATLSLLESDPHITILDDTVDFGDIPAGTKILSPNNFLIKADDTTPHNYMVTFGLDITDARGKQWHKDFRMKVPPPLSSIPAIGLTRLDINDAKSYYPEISCDDNGGIYVVWQDNRNGRFDIYFNYSHNYGATWQTEDIRLDTDAPGSANSTSPQISCDNNGGIYVVWHDDRNSTSIYRRTHDIYFNYSHDYGATWQAEDIRLDMDEPGAAFSYSPKISCDDNGNVYVVWQDTRNGVYDIYLNYSSDYGATWQGNDIRLDTDEPGSADSNYPRISCDDNGGVYVVWQDYRNGKSYDIYFNHSSNYGATWQSEDIRLNTGWIRSEFPFCPPQISCNNNGGVYVVWRDDRNGRFDIYFNYSTDSGVTWQTEDIRLDTDEPGVADSEYPRISCDDNGNVYVVWQGTRNGVYDIYLNYSSDYGATWQGNDIRLDTDEPRAANSYYPQIACGNDGGVYVAWHDYRDARSAIYFNYSTDSGVTWQESDIKSYSLGSPRISCDNNGNAYVVSYRDLHNIYFIPLRINANTGFPNINPIADQKIAERQPLEFIVVATNSQETPVELLLNTRELPQDLRDNLSNATFTTDFNEPTGKTIGTFRWIPGPFSIGEYYPVTLVARNLSTGRFAYQVITISVVSGEAVLSYKNYRVIDDWSGRSFMVNGDTLFNPGERIELQIVVENIGTLPATNVGAALSLPTVDPYITILDSTINIGDVPLSTSVLSLDNFLIEAKDTTPDNHMVTFGLDITDSEGKQWHNEFQMKVLTTLSSIAATGDIRLDTDEPGAANSKDPQISCDEGGNIYVVWSDERNGRYDIYFNYSHDCGATWQVSDIRLDTDKPGSTGSRYPQISCDNNGGVYVVWQDGWDIYFNYSHDYGATWQTEDIRLNKTPGYYMYREYHSPQISCDESGNIYVVWVDGDGYFADNIYFDYSRDYGTTWQGEDIRLDTDKPRAGESYSPQISCDDNGGVYVVWQDDRNGRFDIYCNYSHDHGATWQESDIRLNTDAPGSATSWNPQISCDNNGGVYVVWQDERNGTYDIYFNYSRDYGATWQGNDIRLDTDEPGSADSNYPRISCDESGGVYVVWSDRRGYYGDDDIYFNYSHDYGATWQAEDIRLNKDVLGNVYPSSHSPQINCDDGGNIYVAWQDWRNDAYDIYFNYSRDYGVTWQARDVRLDTDAPGSAYSYSPQISCDNNGNAYIVWEDERSGGSDIYFRTNREFPYLSSIADQETAEGEPLEFTVTATNSKGAPLELFFDTKGLPQDLQDNLSNATFTTDFDEATGETTGTFSWTPDSGTAGEYYPVVFAARNEFGRCAYQPISINVLPLPPVADFIAVPNAGDVPLTVKFTDTSTGVITSRLWDFGDFGTSTEKNPTHTYKYVGTYTASLTVKGPGGESEKKDYINVIFRGRVYDAYADKDIVMYGDVLNLYGEVTGGTFTSYAWLCDGRELIRGDLPKIQRGIVTIIDSVDISWANFAPGTHTIQLKARNEELGIDRYSEPFTITVARDGKTIQNDINNALPGDTVYIEAGTYKLTSDLIIKKNIKLLGSSPLDTIILLGKYHILVKRPILPLGYRLNAPATVTIEAMTITGHVYTGASKYGPIQNYANKLTFKDCRILNNEGIMVSAIYSQPGSNLYLENALIAGNRTLPADDASQYGGHLNYNCYSGTIYLGTAAKLYMEKSTIADNINGSASFTITEPQTGYGQTGYGQSGYGIVKEVTVNYGAIHRTHVNYISIIDSIMWSNGNDTDEMRDISQIYEKHQRRDIANSDIQQLSVLGEGLFDVIHEDPELDSEYIPLNSKCSDKGYRLH